MSETSAETKWKLAYLLDEVGIPMELSTEETMFYLFDRIKTNQKVITALCSRLGITRRDAERLAE